MRAARYLVCTLFASALGAMGCTPDLGAPPSLVDQNRILAVQSTPAEARPGRDVRFRVLIASPDGTFAMATPAWAFCTTPKPLSENNAVALDCNGAGVMDFAAPPAAADSCDDGDKNFQETDGDCGGPVCPACRAGLACIDDLDCASGLCAGGVCKQPVCDSDGLCLPFGNSSACGNDNDCLTNHCAKGLCVLEGCDDKLLDDAESDVDCGGGCLPCGEGQKCVAASDCGSGHCAAGICVAPSCTDGVKNGKESGVDCGGDCGACGARVGCDRAAGCAVSTLPEMGCSLFGPDTPPAGPNMSQLRPRDPDVTGGYYQPVRTTLIEGAPNQGDVVAFALERMTCNLAGATIDVRSEFKARYLPNTNPRLGGVLGKIVGNDGAEPLVPEGAAAGAGMLATVPAGASIVLRANWTDGSAERYPVFDVVTHDLVDHRETLRVSWYATAGSFEHDATGRGEAELQTWSENTWQTPAAGGPVHLWAVLRDSRGGIDFASFTIAVAP